MVVVLAAGTGVVAGAASADRVIGVALSKGSAVVVAQRGAPALAGARAAAVQVAVVAARGAAAVGVVEAVGGAGKTLQTEDRHQVSGFRFRVYAVNDGGLDG